MLDQAWLSSLAYSGREWDAADPLAMATDDLMKTDQIESVASSQRGVGGSIDTRMDSSGEKENAGLQ